MFSVLASSPPPLANSQPAKSPGCAYFNAGPNATSEITTNQFDPNMCTQGLQSKINAIYHDTSSLAPADEAKWFVKEFSQKFKIDQEAYDAFFLAYDKGPNATTLGVACDFLKNTKHMNRLGWLSEIEKIGPMPDAPTTNNTVQMILISAVVVIVSIAMLGLGVSYVFYVSCERNEREALSREKAKLTAGTHISCTRPLLGSSSQNLRGQSRAKATRVQLEGMKIRHAKTRERIEKEKRTQVQEAEFLMEQLKDAEAALNRGEILKWHSVMKDV